MPTSYEDVEKYGDYNCDQAIKDKHITYNLRKLRMIVKYLLDYNFEHKNVVELGSGFCLVANALKRLYGEDFHYTGVDISSEFQRVAAKIGMKVVQGNMTKIPLPDSCANVVFLMDSLEHIEPCDRGKVYLEIDRVLDKKDAMIFINSPVSKSAHLKEFDFGYNINDLAELVNTLKGSVLRIQRYFVESYGPEGEGIIPKSIYDFIVVGR